MQSQCMQAGCDRITKVIRWPCGPLCDFCLVLFYTPPTLLALVFALVQDSHTCYSSWPRQLTGILVMCCSFCPAGYCSIVWHALCLEFEQINCAALLQYYV
jgi:hypothetical protein